MSKATEQEKIDEIKKFCDENGLNVHVDVRNVWNVTKYDHIPDWGVGFSIGVKNEIIVSVQGWNTVQWIEPYIILHNQNVNLGYVRKRLLPVVKDLVEQYQAIEYHHNRIKMCRENIKNIFALNGELVKK